MARARNPKRNEAYQLYADSGGKIKLADLAAQLNIPASRIRKWKTEDKWEEKIKERSDSGKRSAPIDSRDKKGRFASGNTAAVGHGAPPKNQNSVGHRSSVPLGNQNSRRHGFYSRFIPVDDVSILMDTPGAGMLECELRLARYKLTRLIECQEKRKMTGYTSDGVEVKMLDDFYEPLIQKQIRLISRLEKDLCRIQMANDGGTAVTIIDDFGGGADG